MRREESWVGALRHYEGAPRFDDRGAYTTFSSAGARQSFVEASGVFRNCTLGTALSRSIFNSESYDAKTTGMLTCHYRQ